MAGREWSSEIGLQRDAGQPHDRCQDRGRFARGVWRADASENSRRPFQLLADCRRRAGRIGRVRSTTSCVGRWIAIAGPACHGATLFERADDEITENRESGVALLGGAKDVGELRPRPDVSLLEDVPQVRLDRVRAEEQLLGDLLVREALGDQTGNDALLRRQLARRELLTSYGFSGRRELGASAIRAAPR